MFLQRGATPIHKENDQFRELLKERRILFNLQDSATKSSRNSVTINYSSEFVPA